MVKSGSVRYDPKDVPMTNPHRVLLVDDEPLLLGVVRRIVEAKQPGARVVYACDAATAMWQLQSTSIRLVVTDLRMNADDLAGLKVVEAARSAGVPVAILSGAASSVLEQLAAQDITVVPKDEKMKDRLATLVASAFEA